MDNSQYTILVVDDNLLLRDLVVVNVEMEGYQVITAENGLEALNMLRSQTVDLMLLDIMMPVMNGYEVLQQMQSDPELSRTPVIVMSALTDMDNLVRCVELGAEDGSAAFGPRVASSGQRHGQRAALPNLLRQ